MEPGLLELILADIGAGVRSAHSELTPLAVTIAGYLLMAEILLWCISIVEGFSVATMSRILIVTAVTRAALVSMPDLVMGILHGARNAVGLLIPGYEGPTNAFQFAIDTTNQLGHASVALSFSSLSGAVSSIGALMAGSLIQIIVFFGLSFVGFLALLAELEFLIGSLGVVLTLPFFMLSATSGLAWRSLSFMVSGALRIVLMGAFAHLFHAALSQRFGLRLGAGEPLTSTEVFTLLGVSGLLALAAGRIFFLSNSIVGAAGGHMHAISQQAVGAMTSAGGSAARSVGSAMGGSSSSSPSAGGGGWAGGGWGGSGGAGGVGSASGSGSPFPARAAAP